VLTDEELCRVRELGIHLGPVWQSSTTTARDRKRRYVPRAGVLFLWNSLITLVGTCSTKVDRIKGSANAYQRIL
jgi:hypothetical protein